MYTIFIKILISILFLFFLKLLQNYANALIFFPNTLIVIYFIGLQLVFIMLSTLNYFLIFGIMSGISIITYVIISYDKTYAAIEGAIKYFCLSTIATCFMCLGCILNAHVELAGFELIFINKIFLDICNTGF